MGDGLSGFAGARGQGPAVGRWARALAAAALFCLCFLVVAVLALVLTEGLFGYMATAFFPSPAASAAGLAFLGLEASLRAALWRRFQPAP